MKMRTVLWLSRPDSGRHFLVLMLQVLALAFAHNAALAQCIIHPLGCLSASGYALDRPYAWDNMALVDQSSASHAAIWFASSFVDLNPKSTTPPQIFATSDQHQIGFDATIGTDPAALWSGAADSYLDNHAALGADYTNSFVWGLWGQGGTTYVCGWALGSDGRRHAILGTVPSGFPLQPQLRITTVPPDEIRLTAEVSAGKSVTFEMSTDLVHWGELSTMVATNGTVELIEKNTGSSGGRFYRVRVAQ